MEKDESYLKDKTTVYPVYVDPSFHVYSITGGLKTIQDATIYTNYFTKEGSLDWIYAGAYPGSRGTARALVKFPGLVYTDPFQSLNDSQILSVKYMVHNTNPGYIPPSTVSAYMMTRHWVESDVKYSALLWNAAGQYLDSKNLTADGTSSSGTGTGNWYGFNITSAALQWKNYTAANHGIMLRDTVESKYVKAFYSSDSVGSPHVEVEYSQYISNPAPGVENGGVYYVQNFNSYLYMDVYNGGTENGTMLIQHPFHGALNQQMQLIRDSGTGYYKIAPMNAPGKVLTIGDYGSVVLDEDCSLNTQLWRIETNCDIYYFISRTDEMSYLSVINHEEWTASLAVLPRGTSSAWRIESAQVKDTCYDITTSLSRDEYYYLVYPPGLGPIPLISNLPESPVISDLSWEKKLLSIPISRKYHSYPANNTTYDALKDELNAALGTSYTRTTASKIHAQYGMAILIFPMGPGMPAHLYTPESVQQAQSDYMDGLHTLVVLVTFKVAANLNPFDVNGNIKFKPESSTLIRDANGHWIYPGQNGNIHTDGFMNGVKESATLKNGDIITRFGNASGGYYAAPEGTPFSARSLPPDTNLSNFHRYRVLKDIPVQSGITAPWFNQPGGGVQYQFSQEISYYLNSSNGYLIEIP